MTGPATGTTSMLVEYRAMISEVLGILGVAVLLLVIANRLARRAGGWYLVRRRVRREVRLTAVAFAAPVRRWIRYRRQLRLLSRLLADADVWRAGEQAMRAVHAVTPGSCRPYATVVGAGLVGVFIAGRDVPAPPAPWTADDTDANLWWSTQETWQGPPAGGQGPPVLLTAMGADGPRVVFLDLADGPSVTALYGDERAAGSLLQAVAAQLDRRLPPRAVTVAQGVHPRHAGPPIRQALRDAAAWQKEHGLPAFTVCAEPLPDTVGPLGPSVLMRGRTHGRVRLLSVSRDGGVVLHGTPLRPEATALARAVARAIGSVPGYRPPSGPAARATAPAPEETATALGRSASTAAPAATPAATTQEPQNVRLAVSGGSPRPGSAERARPEPTTGSVGVSALGATPPAGRSARDESVNAGARASTSVSASADAPVSGPADSAAASGHD
jgi:hypothetical protein